ncbi:MAG: hypothetical protein IPI83_14885 [Sphingomonadales bacterium]|nr:hypothetical protein [Sphingomonadales bacterium]
MAKFGGVEGDIWCIGDSVENDLVGARQAVGAITLYKVEGKPTRPASDAVDAVFANFADVRQLFASQNVRK